jgi:hypothetical protein
VRSIIFSDFFLPGRLVMNGTRRRFFQDAAILGVGLFGMASLGNADEKRALKKNNRGEDLAKARRPNDHAGCA